MVKATPNSYEEIRQQRMEENKKRMEELNLTKLALAVRNSSQKASPIKKVKPRISSQELSTTEVRRSSRVANLPTPVYKDVPMDIIDRPRRYSNNRRDLSNRVYASDEARMNAIERAEDLESILSNGFPSFVKPMLQSHVTGGFWLGLPRGFAKKNLPKRDETIILVDQNGDEWSTVYLAEKAGLSGGWRAFSLDHKLVDGDALVFELVKRTEFKVYIVRVNEAN